MAKDQGEIVPKPRLSLVAKFSIFSLLPFLVIGSVLEWWVGKQTDKAFVGREAARVVAESLVTSRILAGQDLDRGILPEKFQEIHKNFVEQAIFSTAVGVNIWNRGGRIVYSNRFYLVGKELPINAEVKRALRGETVAVATMEAGHEMGEWESATNSMRVYVPLRLEAPDKISGVYEAKIDMTSHQQLVRGHKKRVWLTAGAAFLLLYLSLFFIFRGASRTISRQQRSLAEAYEVEKERAAERALLLKTSQAISSSLNLAEILDTLAQQIVQQIGVTFCRILLLDRTGTLLTVHAAYPIRELNWKPNLGSYFGLDSLPLFKKVMEERQPSVMVSEVVDEQITASERDLTFNAGADAKSVLVLPIVAKERALGVITIDESHLGAEPFFIVPDSPMYGYGGPRGSCHRERHDLC